MALGQILSQSLSRGERQMTPAARPTALSKTLNRLISAAVVSPRFCGLLLSDPVTAIAAGYNGETFQLTPTEYAAVTSIHANNVRNFAAQLLEFFQNVPEAPLVTQAKDLVSDQPAPAPTQWQESDSKQSHYAKSARSVRHTMPTVGPTTGPTTSRYPSSQTKTKRHGT